MLSFRGSLAVSPCLPCHADHSAISSAPTPMLLLPGSHVLPAGQAMSLGRLLSTRIHQVGFSRILPGHGASGGQHGPRVRTRSGRRLREGERTEFAVKGTSGSRRGFEPIQPAGQTGSIWIDHRTSTTPRKPGWQRMMVFCRVYDRSGRRNGLSLILEGGKCRLWWNASQLHRTSIRSANGSAAAIIAPPDGRVVIWK